MKPIKLINKLQNSTLTDAYHVCELQCFTFRSTDGIFNLHIQCPMRLSVDGIRLKNPKKIRTYLLKASRSGLLKNAEVLTPGAGILRIRFKNRAVLLILPERNSYEEQWRLIDVINKEEYHLVYFCKKYQFH